MKRRIAIGRLFCACFAAGFIAATVYLGLECRRLAREFYEWIDARPVAASVDFSQGGAFSAPFKQTCSTSHGEAFYLALASAEGGGQTASQLLAGLEGTITITDAAGKEVVESEIFHSFEEVEALTGPVMVANFRPFLRGDYVVTIDIAKGAPALVGMPQTVYAKYELCGLERMPAMITCCLAILCGILAFFTTIPALIGFFTHGIWKASVRPPQQPDQPAGDRGTDH